MYRLFTLLVTAAVFRKAVSEILPEHSPCKLNDSKCLTDYTRIVYPFFVGGNEELGVPSSDPLLIDNIEGNLSGIQYSLTNCTLIGLKDCDFKSVEASKDHKQVTFKMYYPKTRLSGHYSVNGSLLTIPINGDGGIMLELNDYWINIVVDVEKVPGKDGTTTIMFKKFQIDADLKGPIDFKVENLLSDNNKLADSFFKVIRENSKILVDFLQGPALNTGYKKVFQNSNKYLKNISIDKLIQE